MQVFGKSISDCAEFMCLNLFEAKAHVQGCATYSSRVPPPHLCAKHGSNAPLLPRPMCCLSTLLSTHALPLATLLPSISSSSYPNQLQIVHSNRRGGAAHRPAPGCSRNCVEQDARDTRSSKVKTCLQKTTSNSRSQIAAARCICCSCTRYFPPPTLLLRTAEANALATI